METRSLSEYHVSLIPTVSRFLREHLGGEDKLTAITQALARPPRYTAVRVNTLTTTRDAALAKLRSGPLADFNARLVASNRPPVTPFAHPSLSDVIVIPSAPPAPCPLEYDAECQKEVILDRVCGEAVLRGSDIFAKGIMAVSEGVEAGDDVQLTVELEHTTTRGRAIEAHSKRRVFIGVGVASMTRGQIFHATGGLAVRVTRRVCGDAPPMNGVMPTEIYIQNLPSSVVAHALGPQPGETIIDLCSAPGGKSTHIASLMCDTGTLVSCDRSRNKVKKMLTLVQEMSSRCMHPIAVNSCDIVLSRVNNNDGGDDHKEGEVDESTNPDRGGGDAKPLHNSGCTGDRKENRRLKRKRKRQRAEARAKAGGGGGPASSSRGGATLSELLEKTPAEIVADACATATGEGGPVRVRGFPPESFDRVLLDPPCSAMGLRPRLVHDATVEDLERYVKLQRNLMWTAVFLLKPGGTLVFSTCTLNPLENEGNVRYILDAYPCMSLVATEPRIGEAGAAGCGLSETECALVQRFCPSGPADTNGFFFAKFVKGGSVLADGAGGDHHQGEEEEEEEEEKGQNK